LKKSNFIHIKLVTLDTGFVDLFALEISALISSPDKSENCKPKFSVSIVLMQFNKRSSHTALRLATLLLATVSASWFTAHVSHSYTDCFVAKLITNCH